LEFKAKLSKASCTESELHRFSKSEFSDIDVEKGSEQERPETPVNIDTNEPLSRINTQNTETSAYNSIQNSPALLPIKKLSVEDNSKLTFGKAKSKLTSFFNKSVHNQLEKDSNNKKYVPGLVIKPVPYSSINDDDFNQNTAKSTATVTFKCNASHSEPNIVQTLVDVQNGKNIFIHCSNLSSHIAGGESPQSNSPVMQEGSHLFLRNTYRKNDSQPGTLTNLNV
jgi:hypothetical protein